MGDIEGQALRTLRGAFMLILCCFALLARGQTPAASPPANPAAKLSEGVPPAATIPKVDDATINFSSRLPGDWKGLPTVVQKIEVPYPAAAAPSKGDACIEVELTARHGENGSVIVVLALPFECYGQTMTVRNLADFGEGAAAGLKKTFAIFSQGQNNYSLGNHTIWIERADGTPLHRPEKPYTFEIACTVMAKGVACWMTMAADALSLRDFEQQEVTLEGETFKALVPAEAVPTLAAVVPRKGH